jgi:hypothetical protein
VPSQKKIQIIIFLYLHNDLFLKIYFSYFILKERKLMQHLKFPLQSKVQGSNFFWIKK